MEGASERVRSSSVEEIAVSLRTSSFRYCYFLGFAVWLAQGHLQAQVQPGDVLIGEDANYYYYMRAAKYRGSAAEKLGLKFCRSKQAVAADQRALRTLGFGVDNERLQLFETIGREQKLALERQLYDALFNAGLDATDSALASAQHLNLWNVNKTIRSLEGTPLHNSVVSAALRRIARERDKPALAAAYHNYKQALQQTKDVWQAESSASKDPDNVNLRLLAATLRTALGEEGGLAIASAEVSESLVYLGYASSQVNDIAKVSGEKLARLAELSQRLKSHVAEMAESKSAWRKATGNPTATPICGH